MASLLQNSSHSNQGIVLDRASIQHCTMTNRHVVANRNSSIASVVLLGGNYNSTVLHVGVLTDRDSILVAYK